MKRIVSAIGAMGIVATAMVVAAPTASATQQNCTNDTKSVLSHTWDGATGTVVITHTGEKPLCKTLHVAVASWTFDVPEQGQWPQTAAGSVRGSIQNPGDKLVLTAPAVCGQRDAYAEYGKEPVIGDTLTGPGKPYEAKFVHNFSKGVNTYGHDNPASCVPQDIVMPEAELGQICEIGQSSAVAQFINAMSDKAGSFTAATSDGRTFTESLEAGEVKEIMFPFTGTITVTITAKFGDDVYELLEKELSDESCSSETPTPTPTPSETKPAEVPSSPPATSSIIPPTSTSNPPTLAETGASADERPGLIKKAASGVILLIFGIIAMIWGYRRPKGDHL